MKPLSLGRYCITFKSGDDTKVVAAACVAHFTGDEAPAEVAAVEEQRAHDSLESEPVRAPDTAAAACGPVEMATSDINPLQGAFSARAPDDGHAPASVPDEQTAPGADPPCSTVG